MAKIKTISNQIEELEKAILERNDWRNLSTDLIEIINKKYCDDDKTNMLIKTRHILKWALNSQKDGKVSG